MIKTLVDFTRWSKTIITSIIGVLSGVLIKGMEITENNFGIVLIAVIILIVVISKVVEFSINTVISKSKSIRKLLLGKNFIEGYWVEGVIDISEINKVESLAIIKITFIENHYSISGESFALDNKLRGSFHSMHSDYQNFCLKYSYEGINSEHKDSKVVGNGELRFTPNDKFPKRLSGNLIDNFHKERVMVTAEKIDETKLSGIDISKSSSKVTLIKEYLAELRQQNVN